MPPQKTKRPRPAPVASPTEEDASQQTTTQRPRKRAKPTPPASPAESDRPARVSKKAGKSSSTATAKKATTAGPSARRRRSSLQEVQPEEAQNQSAQSKVDGRRRRRSNGEEGDGAQTEVAPRKRGPKPRGRPSADGSTNDTPRRSGVATTHQSQEQEPSPKQPARRRRRSSVAPDESEDAPPPSPPKPYTHIARRTRRIRRSHISSKWSPLTGPPLAAANTILTLAHRPILQRLSQTSQRRQHTLAALRLITNRINRRLARGIPFPPSAAGTASGRETELDFEGVLDGRGVLERQLDPGLHAVELLKREKKRVEDELERDYETLRNLEAGARGQARQQRELLKKAHVLAPEESRRAAGEDRPIFKREDSETKGPLFTDLQDEGMKAVALQLGGHVESMRTNLQQVEGIALEMAKSRAALQSVLMKHLDEEQYEKVVLG